MKKLVSIIFSFFFTLLVTGQPDSILRTNQVLKLSGEIVDFTTDNLGNIYLLTSTNQVKKINSKGDSIAIYNDVKRYGKIWSIDATNPLKVLVYYKDFSTIVVLDRLLNARNILELRTQNIFQVTAITSSYDNNIWLYDEMESKLKKIDGNGNILLESTDLRQVFDSVPSPTAMFDRDGQLYLYDPKKGLLVFDYYGGNKNNYQFLQVQDLQVIDKNTITGRDSTHLLLYKPQTLQSSSFTVFKTPGKFKKINFNGSFIYGLTKDGELEVYSVMK